MLLCGGDFQSKLDFCTQSRTRCIEKFFFCLWLWLIGDNRTLVKLKCCSLQYCSFFGDGKIFEKEEPLERLVPYGSNNNHNKDNNILGSVQCLV